MAKKTTKRPLLVAFPSRVKVEVREPEFEPLASLASLDFARLARGTHELEIGFVHGGCCRKLVRAVVKNGLVVGCKVEPCKDAGQEISPTMLALLRQARAKVTAGKKWRPVPLRTFVGSAALMRSLIILGGGCIFICIFNHCLMCCWWPRPHCFVPVIATGPL